MPDFEAEIAARSGYLVEWEALRAFAGGIIETWDCLIVALDPDDLRSLSELEASDFSGCRLVIEGVDSTEWRIRSIDADLVESIRRATSQ
jgi:hypothetical protein